jgi:xylan 1,4-beta-xylosidase
MKRRMQKMQYKNPIIPGFHPDPSICRVGEDYYLVTSSFEYFPGIPLYHSKDLIHWEQIGHCLTRDSQITLAIGFPNTTGIYAPTIRYHNGRFYVITTNVSYTGTGAGNFIVWTDDPFGEWSDPIWIDLPGIDPSLYFEEDGRVYYTGTYQNIFLCEIDIETGKRLGEKKDIWGGTGGADPEGPHLFKMYGYYYLFISEGGTSQGHMITVARSKNIEGPYLSCPRNPVLTNRSLPLPIKAVGHADLIEAHDGSWWSVCLGIRPVPYPDRHHLGRETFLAPVKWDDDKWPIFGNNGSIDLVMEAEILPEVIYPENNIRDDFDKEKLDFCWNFIYNPDNSLWSLSEKKGFLTLRGNEINLNDKETSAWLGRRQEHMDCTVQTQLTFEIGKDGEEAGLSIFLNCDHHYEIALTMINNQRTIIFRRRIGSLWKVENTMEYHSNKVIFELKAAPNTYSFGFIDADGKSVAVGKGEVHYLSTEVGGKFTGNYIVLYATGNGSKCMNPAHFDWFDYKNKIL